MASPFQKRPSFAVAVSLLILPVGLQLTATGGCGSMGGPDGNANMNQNANENVNENGNHGEPAGPYVGTDACLTCHGTAAVSGTDMSSFLNSGHPFKLNKVDDGVMPAYPFSSIAGALEALDDSDLPLDDGTPDPGPGTDNSLSTPQSYDEITYVIGGFGWKARFIDADGYIVTGSAVQYNLQTEGLVSYHDNEVDKVYNCGNCHTTGWRRYTSEEGDDRNLNRQDDLPGMEGTFAFGGVGCEACHGAGAEHVAAPSSDNITRIATPRTTGDFLAEDMAFGKAVACSECHVRSSEKDYPTYEGGSGVILASGGLLRHHEQYEEMIGINPDDPDAGPTGAHASLDCITCHNPHTTTRYQNISGDPPGVWAECTDCHAAETYEITSGGMADLDCIECHMPRASKSAISFDAEGTGPKTGDIRSHIFAIDLTQENQFTEDGGAAYPWLTGDFACKTCHNSVTSFNINFPNNINIHPG